jgi:hypothetical protein
VDKQPQTKEDNARLPDNKRDPCRPQPRPGQRTVSVGGSYRQVNRAGDDAAIIDTPMVFPVDVPTSTQDCAPNAVDALSCDAGGGGC